MQSGPQPSKFHIALAQIICKTKPARLSIGEYINKLRQQTQTGQRLSIYETDHQYLNAIEYWKGCLIDSQGEIRDLHLKIVEFEKENEILKSRIRSSVSVEAPSSPLSSSTAQRPYTSSGKRPGTSNGKKRPSTAIPGSPTSKRTRVAYESEPRSSYLDKTLEDDFEALGSTPYGTETIYHIWNVHKALKLVWSDPSVLAHHLKETCSNLTKHLTAVAKSCRDQLFQSMKENDRRIREIRISNVEKELGRTQMTSSRVFHSLVYGLAKLADTQSGTVTARQGAVIYSYLQAFEIILDVISTTLELLVLNAEIEEIDGKKALPSPGKGRSWESVAWALSSILVTIISSLDAKHASHGSLFEGILYVLLSRVGKRLYFLTFNQELQPTVEEDIILSSTSGNEESDKSTTKHKVVRMEAKCLIHVLEPAMYRAASFLGSNLSTSATAKLSQSASLSRRPTTSNPSSAKGALTILAKERLQWTLIDAMFGEDEAQNEFVERLTKPRPFPPIPKPPKVDDGDFSSWFTEKVWKLVGWDLLARVDGFDRLEEK